MKKIVFLFVFFSGISTLIAQNTFPTTGNVGIGISTPSTLLHVNGTTRANELQLNGGSTKISIPSTTGGWARGMVYYSSGDFGSPLLGGIGLKGTSTCQLYTSDAADE